MTKNTILKKWRASRCTRSWSAYSPYTSNFDLYCIGYTQTTINWYIQRSKRVDDEGFVIGFNQRWKGRCD